MRGWQRVCVVTVMLVLVVSAVWAAERPAERVSPAPQVNPAAVVWRTPEPPTEPQAGDVWVSAKDGAEMVYVPAGEFTMGSTDEDIAALVKEYPKLEAEWLVAETPHFRACLPGYWIDKTEVTVAQYRKFCEETGKKMPGAPSWGWRDDHPIIGVTWHDAVAYAKWAGKRLPTEMEWEKAARGADGRKYPWGSQWPPPAGSGNFADEAFAREEPDLARSLTIALGMDALSRYDDGCAHTAPVGEFPRGASPYGCLDMAGNVWEWTADKYDKDAYRRYAKGNLSAPETGVDLVLRGGSWGNGSLAFFRCAYRDFHRIPGTRHGSYGFRCVRSP